jgi:hypothetical protein
MQFQKANICPSDRSPNLDHKGRPTADRLGCTADINCAEVIQLATPAGATIAGVSRADLRAIRLLANAVLYFKREAASMPEDIERQMVKHLDMLRRLIEDAPNAACSRLGMLAKNRSAKCTVTVIG